MKINYGFDELCGPPLLTYVSQIIQAWGQDDNERRPACAGCGAGRARSGLVEQRYEIEALKVRLASAARRVWAVLGEAKRGSSRPGIDNAPVGMLATISVRDERASWDALCGSPGPLSDQRGGLWHPLGCWQSRATVTFGLSVALPHRHLPSAFAAAWEAAVDVLEAIASQR